MLVIISLGSPLPATSSGLPGRMAERATPQMGYGYAITHLSPCLALLLVGFAWPATLLPPPVVSYTTVSPSPECFASRQYTSLLHLPSGCPARPLAGTALYGVRTFLSPGEPEPRSPGQLATLILL